MGKRVIIIPGENGIGVAYFLYPNAPQEIADREELIRYSGHRCPMPRYYSLPRYRDYQVEERPDLATGVME